MYIYVHSKCMLLCSLLERERAHVEPSVPQTYRAVHILGPTIRSGQLTNEYSYIPNKNTISGLLTARTITQWSTLNVHSPAATAAHLHPCKHTSSRSITSSSSLHATRKARTIPPSTVEPADIYIYISTLVQYLPWYST